MVVLQLMEVEAEVTVAALEVVATATLLGLAVSPPGGRLPSKTSSGAKFPRLATTRVLDLLRARSETLASTSLRIRFLSLSILQFSFQY